MLFKVLCLLSWIYFSISVNCSVIATPWTVALQAPFVHGILQARILEWVAISSSRESSWPRDGTWVSYLLQRQAGSLPLVPPGKLDCHLLITILYSKSWRYPGYCPCSGHQDIDSRDLNSFLSSFSLFSVLKITIWLLPCWSDFQGLCLY